MPFPTVHTPPGLTSRAPRATKAWPLSHRTPKKGSKPGFKLRFRQLGIMVALGVSTVLQKSMGQVHSIPGAPVRVFPDPPRVTFFTLHDLTSSFLSSLTSV